MLAIYIGYILVLLVYYTISDSWLYEWQEFKTCISETIVTHAIFNWRTFVEFLVLSIVPLGIYWMIRLLKTPNVEDK